jgi:predicted nucleic acid-binding protein
MSLFVDTGYLIALEAADDQNHFVATRHWKRLLKSQPSLITSTYIFDELVTFLNSRNRHAKAVQIGSRLLSSTSIQVIHVDEALFYDGWTFFQKHSDKSYSLTDCISFLLMKRLKIEAVLSFDRHFKQAGFRTLP